MLWKPSGELRLFFTYVMSNNSMTLYIGVTNDLARRVREHKRGEGSSFTSRHHFDRLVYYDQSTDIRDAIAREKQLKGWTRAKKIALIKEVNPKWLDLSAEWEL